MRRKKKDRTWGLGVLLVSFLFLLEGEDEEKEERQDEEERDQEDGAPKPPKLRKTTQAPKT